MNLPRREFEKLQFPSGKTIGWCRREAKKLKKRRGIEMSLALDVVAIWYTDRMNWSDAVKAIKEGYHGSSG